MKKNKYTYKNKIPKQLMKKTTSRSDFDQSNSYGSKRPMQHARKMTPLSQKRPFSQLKRSKRMFMSKSPSIGKLPIVLFMLSLITIILIIPTVIVVPFVNKGEHQGESTDIAEIQQEQQLNDSLFSVAVKRVSAEEVVDVPLETYVARVIASEMPTDFEMEALKAQGLAARTYIVNHLLYQSENDSSDVTDTVEHQVYKDEEELRKQWGSEYNENMSRLIEAVNATKGQIITYNDAPITPAFFSTSNGFTENSEDYWENELPYLKSVKSPWDEESPKYLDQAVFKIADVSEALGVNLPTDRPLTIEMSRTESQRVKELNIEGHTISGRDVREKLQLQSSDFTIKQNNDHLVFTTKGYGHGIGMSQYGANGMAKEGKTYEEIIKYFYQGVEIDQLQEVAPALVSK